MNEKVTLQALAEQLASRHQMEQADAEAFVQTFVALIEEALQQEKYVKVKGLGTFKLIEMSGHNRVSFVPEASLRDLINKPFAHFETVVLNENTHFDDMTEEVLSTDNLSESEEQTEVVEPKAVSDTENADLSAQSASEENTIPEHAESLEHPDNSEHVEISDHRETAECEGDEPAPVKEEETSVTPEVSRLENESEESEETFGETVSEEPEVQVNRRIFRIPWCMIATVLLAGVWGRNCLGSFIGAEVYSRIFGKLLDERTCIRRFIASSSTICKKYCCPATGYGSCGCSRYSTKKTFRA